MIGRLPGVNKAEPDCGTTFTWASRAFGPLVGWMGGWGIIAADVIVMANLAQIAGSYSFTLVGASDLQPGAPSGRRWPASSGSSDDLHLLSGIEVWRASSTRYSESS